MSRSPSKPTISLPRSPYKRSDPKQETAEILEKLNSQLKHLSENILNQEPYLLSVPTDVPYRHSSRAINNWRQGTPFTESEEHQQYLSFLPHQDDGEELLFVEGGWSNYQGEALRYETSPRISHGTGQNTPSGLQRKKISLKDYKTKDKPGDENMSDSQQVNENGIVLSGASPPRLRGGERQEHKSDMAIDLSSGAAHISSNGLDQDGAISPPEKDSDILDSEQPRKRQRTASPQIEITDEAISAAIDAVAKPKDQLPEVLSPKLSLPERDRTLPDLVSPTLPPSMAAYLSTPPPASLDVQTTHHRTDSVRSILASAGMGNSNHVRSDSQHSARSNLSTNAVRLSPGLKNGARTPVRPATPITNGLRSSPGPRQRHIVALKYGKRNRKRVEALLKLGPRAKKVDAKNRLGMGSPEVSDRHLKAVEHASPEKQRKLERSPEVAVKKHKPLPTPLDGAEKPNTPSKQSTNFSHHPSPGVPKPIALSPEKSFKSSAMARVISSDGLEARTPTADRARLSTPVSMDQATKQSPRPISTPMTRDEERSAWQSMADKYFAMGRTIKREASAISQDSENASQANSALPTVLFIEALLCFMINLCAETHKHSSSSFHQDPGWQTILPYHIFVFRTSRRYPHLHGLVTQLGAVCRQYIHKFDLEKLAREPLPEDTLGSSAPTPGSDGNTKVVEDVEKHRRKYLEFRDRLVQNSRELETAWLQGSRELSLDVLEHVYPVTWKGRARDSSRRSVGRLRPGDVPMEYYLPLDANATGFEAVRFAAAFLSEWAELEGRGWRSRIEL